MEKIHVMVNGLPGNMATNVVRHLLGAERFGLVPYSLTGSDIQEEKIRVEGVSIALVLPPNHETAIDRIRVEVAGPIIAVDFTHPTAVCANAALYCRQNLPFAMGTTGGDRERLVALVQGSQIPAVIAPNMAKQIVVLQAMFEFAAQNFAGSFKGFTLEVRESHQKGKADTSGTAKAMVGYFNRLGISFDVSQIVMIRDPEVQRSELDVPDEYLRGHGWHTYTLVSPDGTLFFQFTHNMNGRDAYAQGTLDAVAFLSKKIRGGAKGKVYSMIDVMRVDPIKGT